MEQAPEEPHSQKTGEQCYPESDAREPQVVRRVFGTFGELDDEDTVLPDVLMIFVLLRLSVQLERFHLMLLSPRP